MKPANFLFLAVPAIAAPGVAYVSDESALVERDGGPGGLNDVILGTARVGDGNPHQAYFYKQVTVGLPISPFEYLR